jgi:hypothetical protein
VDSDGLAGDDGERGSFRTHGREVVVRCDNKVAA